MTFPNDPDRTKSEILGREPRGNYVRRADGSWNMFPLSRSAHFWRSSPVIRSWATGSTDQIAAPYGVTTKQPN